MHMHNESSALKSYIKLHSKHQQLPLSPSLKDVRVFTVLNTVTDILITLTDMNARSSAARSAAISCSNICRSAQDYRTVPIYAVIFSKIFQRRSSAERSLSTLCSLFLHPAMPNTCSKVSSREISGEMGIFHTALSLTISPVCLNFKKLFCFQL